MKVDEASPAIINALTDNSVIFGPPVNTKPQTAVIDKKSAIKTLSLLFDVEKTITVVSVSRQSNYRISLDISACTYNQIQFVKFSKFSKFNCFLLKIGHK